MTPIELLRTLFKYDNTIDDYQMVALVFEEFIKLKSQNIYNPSFPINLPYISTIETCLHEYPTLWGSTIPPNCKKCGKQAENWITLTCADSGSVNSGTAGGVIG